MAMTKADLQTLKDIRKVLEMNSANFDRIGPASETVTLQRGQVTAFIRERTRLWRDTWLLSPLDTLIAKYDR